MCFLQICETNNILLSKPDWIFLSQLDPFNYNIVFIPDVNTHLTNEVKMKNVCEAYHLVFPLFSFKLFKLVYLVMRCRGYGTGCLTCSPLSH